MSKFSRVTVRPVILDYNWFSVRATRLWQERRSNQRPQAQKYADYTTASMLQNSLSKLTTPSFLYQTLQKFILPNVQRVMILVVCKETKYLLKCNLVADSNKWKTYNKKSLTNPFWRPGMLISTNSLNATKFLFSLNVNELDFEYNRNLEIKVCEKLELSRFLDP